MEALMNKIDLNIWGRNFELNIIYQNFPNEEIISNQEKTLAGISTIDFDMALPKVEAYIQKYNFDDISEDKITNIFKYVMPKNILIPRLYDKRVVALMCNYKFDMEHGMAVIFENERFKEVGLQDIIL
jgi:hypothetical protein